jgi:hypothetical protein
VEGREAGGAQPPKAQACTRLTQCGHHTPRRWHSLRFGYTDTRGLHALREAIAGLYSSVSAEQLLVLAPQEGILLAMQALLQPGDHVVRPTAGQTTTLDPTPSPQTTTLDPMYSPPYGAQPPFCIPQGAWGRTTHPHPVAPLPMPGHLVDYMALGTQCMVSRDYMGRLIAPAPPPPTPPPRAAPGGHVPRVPVALRGGACAGLQRGPLGAAGSA